MSFLFKQKKNHNSSSTEKTPSPSSIEKIPGPSTPSHPWSSRRISKDNPFPRYGHATNNAAGKEGEIFIFGGLVKESAKNDLWMIESKGLVAISVNTFGESPSARVGHAALLIGNAFIVFGGDTKLNTDDTPNHDESLYLLNTTTKTWSVAKVTGARPSGRYGHSLNMLGPKVIVFGGQVEGFFFNDLVAFDLNSLSYAAPRWELLNPLSAPPPARTNHISITYSDKLYVFGGTNGLYWYNDMWTFDPVTRLWTQLECSGYIPSPREGHSAALVGDTIYIFGGRDSDGVDLGDLVAFKISSARWFVFGNMGVGPSARSGHALCTVGKRIYVVGGEGGSSSSLNGLPRGKDESIAFILDTTKIRFPADAITNVPSNTSDTGNADMQQYRQRSASQPPGTQGVMGRTEHETRSTAIEPPTRAPTTRNISQPSQPYHSPSSPAQYSPNAMSNSIGRPNQTVTRLPQYHGRSQEAVIDESQAANSHQYTPQHRRQSPQIEETIQRQQYPPTRLAPTSPTGDYNPAQIVSSEGQYRNVSESAAIRTSTMGAIEYTPQRRQRKGSLDSMLHGPSMTSVRDFDNHQIASETVSNRGGHEEVGLGIERQGRLSRIGSQELSSEQNGLIEAPHRQSMDLASEPPVERNTAGQNRVRAVASLAPALLQTPPGNIDTLPRITSNASKDTAPDTQELSAFENFPKPHSTHEQVKVQPDSKGLIVNLKSQITWLTMELEMSRALGYRIKEPSHLYTPSPKLDGDQANSTIREALVVMRNKVLSLQSDIVRADATKAIDHKKLLDEKNAALKEAVFARAKATAYANLDGEQIRALENSRLADLETKLAESKKHAQILKERIDSLETELTNNSVHSNQNEEMLQSYIQAAHAAQEAHERLRVEALTLRSTAIDKDRELQEHVTGRNALQEQLNGHNIGQERMIAMEHKHELQLKTMESAAASVSAATIRALVAEKRIDEEMSLREELEGQIVKSRNEFEETKGQIEFFKNKLTQTQSLLETAQKEAAEAKNTMTAGLHELIQSSRAPSNEMVNISEVQKLQIELEQVRTLHLNTSNSAQSGASELAQVRGHLQGLEAIRLEANGQATALQQRLNNTLTDLHDSQSEHKDVVSKLAAKQEELEQQMLKFEILQEHISNRHATRWDSGSERRRSRNSFSQSRSGPRIPDPNEDHEQYEVDRHAEDLQTSYEKLLMDFDALKKRNSEAVYRQREADGRLRDLEEQLQINANIMRDNMVSKTTGGQEEDELFRARTHAAKAEERLIAATKESQDRFHKLEVDYQAAVRYVKNTEKLLKKLKDDVNKYKEANERLEAHVDALQRGQPDLASSSLKAELNAAKLRTNQLSAENEELETRVREADSKASYLLDQFERSLDSHRRSLLAPNSPTSPSLSTNISPIKTRPAVLMRTNTALDSLATELEQIRSHWVAHKSRDSKSSLSAYQGYDPVTVGNGMNGK